MIYSKGAEGQGVVMETAVEEGLTGYLNEKNSARLPTTLISNSIKSVIPGIEGESGYQGKRQEQGSD